MEVLKTYKHTNLVFMTCKSSFNSLIWALVELKNKEISVLLIRT